MGKQAFDAPRAQVFFLDPFRVSIIGLLDKAGGGPLDTAHKKGEHLLWDERINLPVDEAMARNILTYGNQDAVKVRKNGKYPEGHPYEGQDVIEVIEGRQRTRSARRAIEIAKETGVVAPLLKVEFDKTDEKKQLGVMISLNEQRRDDLPSVRAMKAIRVLSLGHSVDDVAIMFGVTTAAIKQWEKFGQLSPNVIRAVDSNELSFSASIQLCDLAREEQDVKLAELIASGAKPTVDNTRKVANGSKPRKVTPKVITKKIQRLLADDEEWLKGLSPDARALFHVFNGDGDYVKRVPGLTAKLRVDG